MKITKKVADCLVRAGSTFREDQKEAYRKAIADEKLESACWVMRQVLDNALVAEERRSPLCDDTGIPHLFLDLEASIAYWQPLQRLAPSGSAVSASSPCGPAAALNPGGRVWNCKEVYSWSPAPNTSLRMLTRL